MDDLEIYDDAEVKDEGEHMTNKYINYIIILNLE